MTNAHTLLAQAKAAADKLKNQAEESAGGDFEFQVPEAGPCLARFVSYIEIGKQLPRGPDTFNKGARASAILQFELLGKKHAREIEVDGVKKTVYPIHREVIVLSNSPRSWAHKLFMAMDYGRGNTHFAFMLGEAFKFNVVHNTVGEGDKKATYANIRDKSGWKVGAPVKEVTDDETGDITVVPLKAPEATVDIRLLLWDAPTKEMWDSIFIDGTRTVKVNGKEEEQSKNWLQNTAVAAKDFEGSALQTMLLESGTDLPTAPNTDPDDGLGGAGSDEDEGNDDPAPSAPKEKKGASTDASADPLAGLDLDDEIPF